MTNDEARHPAFDALVLEYIVDTFGPDLALEALRDLLYTAQEAAEYLGLTATEFADRVRLAKDIQPTKIGRRLYYTKDQLDTL